MNTWINTKATSAQARMKWTGPRRLAPIEYRQQQRKRGVHPRRHGQSRQHHHRQEHHDDHQISEFLQDVVVAGFLALGEAEQQVIPCRPPDPSEIVPCREQIPAEMPTGEARHAR